MFIICSWDESEEAVALTSLSLFLATVAVWAQLLGVL
jgi:hypothetical protein